MIADRSEQRFAALTAGVVLLILYGSLFPFQFHACAGADALRATSVLSYDRGDFLSNILLYLPLGFFGCLALRRSRWAALAMTAAGAALSISVELLQSCDNGRVPSLADVFANTVGAFLGSLLALVWRGEASFAALALACWIGSRLLPYVPSLHPVKYRIALRVFLSTPRPIDIFHYFALWLAAAAFLEAIFGSARSRAYFWWALAIVCGARIVIVDLAPLSAELYGAALAGALWILLARLRPRAAIAAVLVALYIVVNALEPFHFAPQPRRFNWIPFLSFMRSPREAASRVFLEKSFMYAALVWLPVRASLPFPTTAVVAAILVFTLRLAQIYLPGRSAEVTDAIMVLMIAAVMKLMRS